MGRLLGNGVRFGVATNVVAVGEGIETVLALRCALPSMPMIAALSASHLVALGLPETIGRIYIAQDNDEAGTHAATALAERVGRHDVEPVALRARARDFNDDLRQIGPAELAAWLRVELATVDAAYASATGTGRLRPARSSSNLLTPLKG